MPHPKKPPDLTPIPPPLQPASPDASLTDEQKKFVELIGKAKQAPQSKSKPKKP
jgi:hypothetical protein